MAIPVRSIRLRILPTPKYERTAKVVREIVNIIPWREFANINENVNSREAKKSIKKAGSAPKVAGSIK